MSEPLSWVACGVVWWRRTEACMTQSLWTTTGGGAGEAAATEGNLAQEKRHIANRSDEDYPMLHGGWSQSALLGAAGAEE